MKKVLQVKCPKCKKEFNYYKSEYRPFCSERCKMIDLGHWFEETYTVPSKEPLSENDVETILKQSEENES